MTGRPAPRRVLLRTLLPAVLAASLTGCADGPDDDTVTVFAAASLAGPFEELAGRLEAEHDGVEVRLALGGSADLVAQLQQGAPADVVATADEATMGELLEAGLVDEPVTFATGRLALAVPPGNPAGIDSLQDLATGDAALVVCAPQVPCGAAAVRLAQGAGVDLDPVSEEQSVTDVLGKVVSGEADAGLVYATDVRAAGDAVEVVPVPRARDVVNRYVAAPVAGADAPDLAGDFLDLLLSARGRAVLDAAGFGRP